MLAFPLIFLCFLFGSNSQSCTGLTRFNLQGNLLRYYQINDDVLMYLDDRGNVYRTTDGLQTFTQLTTTQLPTSDIAQSLTSSVLPRRIVDGITFVNLIHNFFSIYYLLIAIALRILTWCTFMEVEVDFGEPMTGELLLLFWLRVLRSYGLHLVWFNYT